MKIEVPRYETRIINKIGMLEVVLRADLVDTIVPTYVRSQVQTSLNQILGDQTLTAMFNSHFKAELRHVKLNFQQRLRQLQVRLDSESEKHRQELGKIRQEAASERRYVERQINYLQAELSVTRNDLGRLEQDVSYLMTSWLNTTYGGARSVDRSGQCNCDALAAKVDNNKVEVDRKLQYLEAEDVFLLKNVVQLNRSHAEYISKLQSDLQNYQNSNENLKSATNEMKIMVDHTTSRLDDIAVKTGKLAKGLNIVCENVGMDCELDVIVDPDETQSQSTKPTERKSEVIEFSVKPTSVTDVPSTTDKALQLDEIVPSSTITPRLSDILSSEQYHNQASLSTTEFSP